jgi:hypothetical protein
LGSKQTAPETRKTHGGGEFQLDSFLKASITLASFTLLESLGTGGEMRQAKKR